MAGGEKSNPFGKRKHLTLIDGELRRALVEHCFFELAIGLRRQVEDGDGDLAVGILEARETRARHQARRQLKTDAQAGGKYRLGGGQIGGRQTSQEAGPDAG